MIDPFEVTAVVVTKCTDPSTIHEVVSPLQGFGELIVYDNSREKNRKVYGRYVAASMASCKVVYVQDDDCVIDAKGLCEEYQPCELLCNVLPTHQPFYAETGGISLVGWGAIFPRSMVDFSLYLAKYPEDKLFDRECDRIFTWLNRAKTRVVDIGVQHLPHAHGADRMGKEPRHGTDLNEIRRRLATL